MAFNDGCASERDGLRPGIKRSDPDDVSEMMKSYSVVESSVSENPRFSNTMLSDYPLDDDKNCSSNEGAPISRPGFTPLSAPGSKPTSYLGITSSSVPVPKPALTPEHSPSSVLGSRLCTAPLPRTLSTTVPKPPSSVDSAISSTLGIRQTSAPGTCPSINEDNLLRTVQNPSEGSEDRLTPSIDCIYTSSYAHQDTTATSFDHMSRNLSGVESLIQSNISLTNGAACPSISEEQKQGDASIRTIGKVVESMIHRHILETSKDSTDSTVKRSDSIARRHNVTPTIAENRESISRCSGNEATSINIFSPSSSRAADSISEAKSIICQVCETSFQSTSSELLKTAGCSGFNSPSLDTYTASQATTPTLNTVNCNQINAFPFVASAVKTHSSDTSATATCSVVDAPLSVVVAMTSPTSDNREITSPASVVTASTSPSFVTTSTLPASVATAVKSLASFVRATSPSSVVTATTSPSSVVSAMTSPASDVRAITSPSSVVPASTLPASVTAMTSPASDVKATSSTSVVTASTIPASIITAMTSPASNVRTTISPASVVTTSASPALVVTAMTSPSLDATAMTSPSSVVPATTSPSSVVSAMTSSVSDVRAITSPSSVVTATTSSSSVFTTTTSLASVLTASTLPASVTAMTSPASDVRTTSSASVVTATASSSSVFTTTTSLASVLTASTSPAFDTTSILPASVATAVASPASFVRATSPASVVTASTVPASVTAMTSPASDVRATSSASVVTATTSSSSVFTTTTSPSSVIITMTSPASDVRATSPESVVAASTIPASVITAMTSPASNFRATISPASVVTASVSPTSVVTATTSPSVDATAMTSPASFVTALASPASVVTASASPESGVAATMSLSSVFNASTVPASVEIAISLASVPQTQVNRDRQHWNAPRFPFPYAYGEMRMPSSSRFPFWNQAHWRTAGKDHGYRYTVPCTMSSGPPLPPSCSVTSGSVHTPYQGSGTSTYGAAVFPSNRDMHQLGTLEQPAVRRNGDDLNNIMSKVCSPLQKKAKEEKQYSCKYCKNVRFKTKSGQETHLYRFHDPDKKPGSSRTSVVGHDVYHSAMPPAAVNRFPSAMPDPVVKYHCNKCGEDFLSSSDFRVHINTQNCRVGIAVYDSCIKLQCDGGDRCSFVNSSQSNNKSNAVNDSRADTTDVQLIITEPIKNKFDQSNDKRTCRADNASSTNEIMKDKLDQSNDKRTGRADNASSTNEIMMAKLDQSNDTRTGRADSASSTNEIMMAKLDQSNDTRTGSSNIASSANEIMKAKLDQSKDRKTETANGVLLTKESMMLNQCVLAKKDNIFYLATVKTINKKGTVGVLFKGEEELTYLFNALDPTDRLVISISVPSADSLEIGCKVCVTLSHEQNKFYDGEIKDMRTGSLICYKVCLIHKKDINMFGEALWVHRTAVRLLESPWYRLPANKLGLSKVRDLTGKLQVLKVSTIRPSNKSSSHKHANSIYYNCLTCHSTFASCLAYKIHQGKMHKDETVKGMKILDDEYSIEKSENFSEKSHESYICSSSERTCEDEGKCDSGDETDIYVSDEDSNTGFGGMLTIISESSKESRDAPIESKDRKVERKVVDKENKSDGTELIFKCDYCGDKFQTAKRLRQHRNQHIQKYPYFCDICEKTFKNKDNLRGHLEICKAKKNSNVNIGRKHLENVSSTKKKGYACLDCDKVFSYKTNRSRHEKLIHPNTSGETEMYICQFCSKTFTHQQALYRHKKYIHGKSMNGPMGKQTTVTNCKPSDSMGRGAAGSHVCDVCKKTYSSEDALHQHKLIHSNKCSVCNAVFARKIKLRFHHRKHHSDSGKSVVGLTCDVCSRTFNIKKQLKIHKLVHLSKEPFKCTWCIKMFAQKAALVEHIKNHHTKNETGGNKALVVKVLLKCPEKALNCSVCDREFSTRLGLSMHIQHAHKRKAAKGHRSNHTDEKRRTTAASLSCDVCTKTFITHQHLQRHRNTHLLIKPFKCTPCNKTFAQKGQLRVHNDTHHHGKTGKGRYKQHDVGKALLKSSEKVLRCSLCERDFSTRVGLRIHNFHVHRLTAAGGSEAMHDSSNYTDEKGRTKAVSFACDLCTKTFSKHQHLQQHRNTHLSIKPFKCTPCNKTFAQKGQLRVHNDTHHHGKTGKGRYKQHDVGKALLKSSEKVLRCSLCERDFSTRVGFRMHNFHVHRLTAAGGSQAMHDSSNYTDEKGRTKAVSFACDLCTKTFSKHQHLQQHRNTHLSIKPFKCTPCNKTFAQKGQLRVHNDTHHHGKTGKGRYKQHDVGKALLKSSEKVLRCSLCERDFSTRVGLRKHNFHVHRLTAAGGSEAMHDSSNHTDERERTKSASLTCDVCTKTFITQTSLKRHTNIHLLIKPFKCTLCNKTFAQNVHLRLHIDTHHHGKTGKGIYKQQEVGKALLKSSEKVLRCTLCERDFSTRVGLRMHKFHVHRLTAAGGSEAMHDGSNHTDKRERTKSASLTCDVCTKTFITQTSLKRHRNIHLLIKPFKCTLCNKTFAQKVQLRVHIDTHHHVKTEKGIYKQQEVGKALLKSSEEALSCSLCDRDFSTRAGIRMHNFHIHKRTAAGASEAMHDSRSILQSSSGKDSGTDEVSGSHFSCGICSTTFESGEMLHKHFRTSKCALGSFSRLMAEQRKDSVLTNPDVVSEHSERKSVEYQCGICDLTFPDSSFLELHMTQGCPGRFVKQEYPIENYSSKKLNLFQCGICHLDFSTEIELVSHFQVMHSATKSKNDFENFPDYICGRCNSVFDSGNGLAVHMKACFNGNASELDLETFSCGICQKDFRSADELESHVDIHTQSEYLCGQCGLSFRASDTLIKHVLEEHSCGNAMAIVNSPELEIKDNDIEDVATHINEHDIEDVEADFNGHNIEDVEADVNDHKIEDVEADIIDHNIEDVETDINDHYIEDVEADINDHDIEDVEADINDNDIVNVEADINDHDIEDIEADINDNDIVNVEADINDHNIEAVGTDLNDTCIEHVEADINDHDIEDIAADINDNDIEEVAADLLVVNTDTSLYRNYEVVRENESQRKSVERGVEPFVTDEYTNKDELLENNLVVKTSAAVSNDIVIYPHLYRPSTIINSGNQHTYDISVMPTIVNRPGMPKHATKNRQGMQDVTQISPEVQQYDALNTPRIHQLEDQDLTGLVHNDTQNIGQQCINPYTYPTNSIQSEQIRAPLPNVGFRYPSSQARQLSTLLPGQTHFNIPIHPNIPSLLSNQRITSETSSILSHVPTLVAQFNAINVHKTNNETISYAGILTAETTSIQSSVSQLDYQPKSAFPVVQSTETAIIQNSTSPKSVNRNQSANSEPPFVLVCLCIRCGRYGEPKGSRFYCKACKVLFGNLCCAYCSRTTFQDQFELERHIHSCETYCSKQSRGALKEFRDKQMKSAISLSSVSKQKINENSLCPDTQQRPQYNRCVENSSIIKALAEETEKEFMHGGDKRICAQIDSVCICTSSSNTVNVREANNGLHGKANAMENKPVTPYEQLTQMKIKHDNATGSCLEESKSKDKFEGRFGKCVTLQNIPSIVSANTRKKPKVTTAVVDNTSDSTQTSSNRTSSLHPEFNTTENKSVPTDIENDNTANFYNDAGSSDIHYFASLLPTVVSDPDTTKGSSSGVCHVENNRDECHEYNSKGVTVSDEIPVTGRQTENGADEVVNSDSSKENLVHILNFPDDCIYLNDRKDESVRNDIAEAITEAESVEGRAGDKTRALGSPDTHVDEQTEESTKSPAHSSLYAGIGVQAENALFSDVTSCNHSAGNIIESESEESDGSGFEEIEIDEENIIEESNPRNKYSDIICYDDDINRKNMKSHTSSMIRFDRSNIKIIPCKVILERILRSEVEQITEKNKRRKAIQYLDKREETCVNNKKLSEMKTKSKEKSNSETNTVTKQGQSCEHPVLSLLKKRKQMLLEIRRTNAAIAREKARGIMLIKRRTQYIERNKRTELPKRPITRQETTLNQKKRKRKVNLVDSEGDMVQSDKRRISVDKSRTKLNHMKSRVKTSAKSRVKTSAVVDKVKKLKLQDVVLLCTDSDASGEISSNVLSTTKARECKRLKRTVIPSKKNDITGQVHISKAIVVLEKVMAHKVGVSTEQIQAHKTVGVTEQVQARKVIGVTDQLLTHKAVIELEKIQALKATGATKQVQTRKVVDVTEKLHTRKAVVVLDDIQAHKVVCETEKAQTSKTVGVAENETDCAKANTVYDRTDVRAGIEADSRYVNDDTVSNNDQMHAAEEYFSCEICTVQLSSTKELEEHAKSHLTFDEYKCRECNKTFSTVDTLNKHFEYHKQKEEFLCGICQAQFALPSNLEIHMMEHFEGIVADQKHSETVVRVKSTETVPADSVAQGSGGNPSQPLLSKLLAYKHKFT